MGKETVFKKRPPCIVCEKQEGELQLKETNWICENCAKLCMDKVLKEIPIPFISYSINKKVGGLLIQELLNDHY